LTTESEYAVEEQDFKGSRVHVLQDRARAQTARVLPGVGNNCISYRIEAGRDVVDVLYGPPDPGTLEGRPSGYGIPILFPWPNRIERGRFAFDGQEYQLDVPEPGPHVLHGFVLGRPWVVDGAGSSDEDGAWVRGRFRSADFPEVMQQLPFPFEIVGTYRLLGGVLELEIEATNTGVVDMPAGLGMHPYFPLPLSDRGSRDRCTVQMPAEKTWRLRGDCIPTGEVLDVSGVTDLRRPAALAGRFYDDVWTGVALTDGWSRCVYTDPDRGISVAMEADSAFRELVLYAPENRPVLCFEPYTCTTDAVNLQARGIDAGLTRLRPGETLRGRMRIVPEV
jgi:aldose 1-epimerase